MPVIFKSNAFSFFTILSDDEVFSLSRLANSMMDVLTLELRVAGVAGD
jgi:hypothetical protein